MKLCQLFHESSKCPTCGGPVNARGTAARSPSSQLVFPDKEGVWDTDEGPKTAKELDDPRRTQSFKRTLPLPRR
jgi:hypothetical protein